MPQDWAATRASGVTLVELLTVIAIVGILLTIAAPSFRYVTTANRISSEVNSLWSDMQYARSEAIRQGQTVSLCASANGATCAATNSWKVGWIVFSDVNGDGTFNAPDVLLRVRSGFTSTDTFAASNAIQSVTFNREGFALGLPGVITFTLHDSSNNTTYSRCLALTAVGTLNVQKTGLGNCV